jgi:hypothetical protein
MLSIDDQLADLAMRIARAKARALGQRAHIEDLELRGWDTADANSLLELMASALEQMQDVQLTLSAFCIGSRRHEGAVT